MDKTNHKLEQIMKTNMQLMIYRDDGLLMSDLQ
jgi:hypothetical protein